MRPAQLKSHPFFHSVRWAALLARLVPSPLLPPSPPSLDTTTPHKPTLKRGTSTRAPPQSGPAPAASESRGFIDVFAYPSVLGNLFHAPSMLGGAGWLDESVEAGVVEGGHAAESDGEALGARGDESDSAAVAPWNYVAEEGAGPRGIQLWRSARARADQLARLHGLSRGSFLLDVVRGSAGGLEPRWPAPTALSDSGGRFHQRSKSVPWVGTGRGLTLG